MKAQKKILPILLALGMMLPLAGCKKESEQTTKTSSVENSQTEDVKQSSDPDVTETTPMQDDVIYLGEVVKLGSYKGEEIEWIVVDVNENGEKLLLSRFALDMQPWNTKSRNDDKTNVNWEQSTLRAWLNNDFFNEAFSAEEQNLILTTELNNAVSDPALKPVKCDKTQDKVFCLSYDEVKVLGYVKNAICYPTKYTVERGVYTSSDRQQRRRCSLSGDICLSRSENSIWICYAWDGKQ